MKIKSIEVWKKNLGNRRPYTIAFKTVGDVDNVFVKIELENGIYGLGNGNPSEQVVGESLEDTFSVLSMDNLEFLYHRDIRELNKLCREVLIRFPKNPAARAALDIALYDAFTKHLKIPLGQFLGNQIDSMVTSVTIGIKNVEETLEEAEEYYGSGFRVMKVKTGFDVNQDIERIKKLHEKYGKSVRIRIDANQGYDVTRLLKFYKETQSLGIELIEQPLKADSIDVMKQLPEDIKIKIAADESLLSPRDAFELVAPPKACGIFNIKLMKSGGIFQAGQIATIAESSGIDLMWGCNDESAISISAALHTALSYKNTKYLDLDGSLDIISDAVRGGFVLENGVMSITNKPGLGVELIDV